MHEERIIDVLAQIEYESKAIGQGDADRLGFDMGMWFSDREDRIDTITGNTCGTVACLAGHALVHEGIYTMMRGSDFARRVITLPDGSQVRETVDIQEHAAEYLGISMEASEILFYLDTIDDVYAWCALHMGIDEQVLRDKVAAHD